VALIDFQKQMILVTPKWTGVRFNMQKKGYWSTISCNVVELKNVLTLGNTQEHFFSIDVQLESFDGHWQSMLAHNVLV